jgi:hypothetical protein
LCFHLIQKLLWKNGILGYLALYYLIDC